MKRIIYLIILLLPIVMGCSKPSPAPGHDPVPEKYDRYIFFSQGVETKASLIEKSDDMSGKSFGVVGFKYDKGTTWATLNAEGQTPPIPNVFYEGNNLVKVEECSVDGTNAATYAPLQGWSNTKKYAFFAFYPLENEYVTLVNLDGTPYTGGTPAIKYTMSTTDPAASMVDVMTAAGGTDLYWVSSNDNNVENGDVTFNFQHRLSSLGLNIRNSSAGDIKINSISITISGLKYTGIIIPLDGSQTKYETGTVQNTVFTLAMPEGGETIANGSSEGKEITDKLIFIPQTDDIKIDNITIGYQRLAHGGYTGYEGTVSLPSEEGTEIKTALTVGKKHIIHLNFTDSTVDIKPVTTGAWKDEEPVEDTFN